MPSAPQAPNAFDEIRTADGTTCRSSIGGKLQIYGGALTSKQQGDYFHGANNVDEVGGYIGFSYSLGGGKRVDCSRLSQIETERAELELKKLKAEIATLEQMKKLAMLEASGALPPLTTTQ
ncbi:hypothetical protein ACPV36_12455 [Photobacterium damselae]